VLARLESQRYRHVKLIRAACLDRGEYPGKAHKRRRSHEHAGSAAQERQLV
jgi:hypothetical protein